VEVKDVEPAIEQPTKLPLGAHRPPGQISAGQGRQASLHGNNLNAGVAVWVRAPLTGQPPVHGRGAGDRDAVTAIGQRP